MKFIRRLLILTAFCTQSANAIDLFCLFKLRKPPQYPPPFSNPVADPINDLGKYFEQSKEYAMGAMQRAVGSIPYRGYQEIELGYGLNTRKDMVFIYSRDGNPAQDEVWALDATVRRPKWIFLKKIIPDAYILRGGKLLSIRPQPGGTIQALVGKYDFDEKTVTQILDQRIKGIKDENIRSTLAEARYHIARALLAGQMQLSDISEHSIFSGRLRDAVDKYFIVIFANNLFKPARETDLILPFDRAKSGFVQLASSSQIDLHGWGVYEVK